MRVIDSFIALIDGYRHVLKVSQEGAPYPYSATTQLPLNAGDQAHSIALMRVNHTGEVCAQALYAGQMLHARSANIKHFLQHAKYEEEQHLAWCQHAIVHNDGRTSYLNPFWYLSSFLLGAWVSRYGDAISLGFVYHTEAQVHAHLSKHAKTLACVDTRAYAIVQRMMADEAAHRDQALALGGVILPHIVQKAMRYTAKLMTVSAHYV